MESLQGDAHASAAADLVEVLGLLRELHVWALLELGHAGAAATAAEGLAVRATRCCCSTSTTSST